MVFKPTAVDRGVLSSELQDPTKQKSAAMCPLGEFTLFMASPSFCKLIGFSEVRSHFISFKKITCI